MTVYCIAQMRFTNRAAYDRYQARFMDVFRQFNGRLLAADEAPQVVEGQWDREKVVLMSFPDDFVLPEDQALVHVGRQVGNAVPIALATAIAAGIAEDAGIRIGAAERRDLALAV